MGSHDLETVTFEKKVTNTLTITNENIKQYEVLESVIRQECNIATKKSPNRPWIYLKDINTLKTFGGLRMNKNTIGTLYIDTIKGLFLEDEFFGVTSRDTKDYVSNKIVINDLKGLKKMIKLINELKGKNVLYTRSNK